MVGCVKTAAPNVSERAAPAIEHRGPESPQRACCRMWPRTSSRTAAICFAAAALQPLWAAVRHGLQLFQARAIDPPHSVPQSTKLGHHLRAHGAVHYSGLCPHLASEWCAARQERPPLLPYLNSNFCATIPSHVALRQLHGCRRRAGGADAAGIAASGQRAGRPLPSEQLGGPEENQGPSFSDCGRQVQAQRPAAGEVQHTVRAHSPRGRPWPAGPRPRCTSQLGLACYSPCESRRAPATTLRRLHVRRPRSCARPCRRLVLAPRGPTSAASPLPPPPPPRMAPSLPRPRRLPGRSSSPASGALATWTPCCLPPPPPWHRLPSRQVGGVSLERSGGGLLWRGQLALESCGGRPACRAAQPVSALPCAPAARCTALGAPLAGAQ
jgi:hypothetical protein